ncbi:glycoside hydrolase/deacetylase [Auriculariales sp. MPI-PUGE-AT-0066]|nr:glycoside hydrolase/deacetylase [Auriculariales sp. MPI-PUGE-AT-0066]
MVVLAVVLVLAAVSASAHPHVGRAVANGAWYHESGHTVTSLFARGPGPEIGSREWVAQYPSLINPPSEAERDIPAQWLAAYNTVKAAGKIPDIPVSVRGSYAGHNPMSKDICSSAGKCRAPGDIWDAPDGKIGFSFDDGPWLGTDKLLDFMSSVNTTCTHYFIGRNIALRPQLAVRAFNEGHELAVHTWSHPPMTGETDLGILVQLGWTMQIIHDITGGRVPKYWRPPTGDMDNRVRAIAREVFGLTPVLWNYDTADWTLGLPRPTYTPERMAEMIHRWVSGPKSPGLIILQHELSTTSVDIWINNTYAGANQYGWEGSAIGPMFDLPMYQNAQDNTSPVTEQTNMAVVPPDASASASASGDSTSGGQQPTLSGDSPGATTSPGGAVNRRAASLSLAISTLLVAIATW